MAGPRPKAETRRKGDRASPIHQAPSVPDDSREHKMRAAFALTAWSVLFFALLVGAGWIGHTRQCNSLTPGTQAYRAYCG